MSNASLLDERWSEVLSRLPSEVDLDTTAREHGALRRSRCIRDGQRLLRLALLYGPGGASLRGAAAWAAQVGVGNLSDVAVLKRLRGAGAWLEHLVGALMSARVGDFANHRPLRLADGSVITGPGGADWRLHTIFDPVAGCLTHLELTDTKGAETLKRGAVTPDEIRIADRNYARPADLRHIVEGGGDFIVRTGWTSLALRTPGGVEFDLFGTMKGISEDNPGDVDLIIKDQKGRPDVPARLIILRKPEEAAERERRRVRRRASKTGKKMDPRTLAAADYKLIVTSLSRAEYDATRIAALYRLRWQIEIAFKRLKSILRIDRLPAKDPGLARSWITTHLILALLIEDIAGEFPDSPP